MLKYSVMYIDNKPSYLLKNNNPGCYDVLLEHLHIYQGPMLWFLKYFRQKNRHKIGFFDSKQS
jgi:hypothetical protein